VLDEVVRFKRTCASSEVRPETSLETRKAEPAGLTMETSTSSTSPSSAVPIPRLTPTADAVRRHSLASMLSEALCSRARRISERRTSPGVNTASTPGMVGHEDEIPFARRAREVGKEFSGGKRDGALVDGLVISSSLFSQISQYWWQLSHPRLHSTLIEPSNCAFLHIFTLSITQHFVPVANVIKSNLQSCILHTYYNSSGQT
jgi:protein phosphatase PTC7